MLCGPFSTGMTVTSLIRPGSRLAVFSNGRIRSAVPCRTRTGTSMLRQVGPEVGQPGVHARVRRVRRGGGGDVEGGLDRLLADLGAAEHVGVVEVGEEVAEVGVPVGHDRGFDALEHRLVDAFGVVAGLEQERRDRPQQRGLLHPRGAVRAQVVGYLPGAHGEPAQVDVGQVQVFQHRVQVGGKGVVVVPGDRLAGIAEPAPVIRDHPVPGRQQVAFLPLPGPAVQRVAVNQHDRLTRSVVFVVDVDAGAVLAADRNEGHGSSCLSAVPDRSPVFQPSRGTPAPARRIHRKLASGTGTAWALRKMDG